MKEDIDVIKRRVFGVMRDGEDWEAMLKRRATLSASVKRAASAGVPETTLREYDRWKEGVSLSAPPQTRLRG